MRKILTLFAMLALPLLAAAQTTREEEVLGVFTLSATGDSLVLVNVWEYTTPPGATRSYVTSYYAWRPWAPLKAKGVVPVTLPEIERQAILQRLKKD